MPRNGEQGINAALSHRVCMHMVSSRRLYGDISTKKSRERAEKANIVPSILSWEQKSAEGGTRESQMRKKHVFGGLVAINDTCSSVSIFIHTKTWESSEKYAIVKHIDVSNCFFSSHNSERAFLDKKAWHMVLWVPITTAAIIELFHLPGEGVACTNGGCLMPRFWTVIYFHQLKKKRDKN